MVMGAGVSFAMDFLASFAVGSGNEKEAEEFYLQGIWVALLIFVPSYAIYFLLTQNLHWFGTNPEIIPLCEKYSVILGLTLLPNFLFSASRSFLQAHGRVAPAFSLLILGNILNLVANIALVYGRWGAPELGIVGSAWATFIARFTMAILILWIAARHIGRLPLVWPVKQSILKILRMGLPASSQMVFEVGAFATATTLAGRLSSVELATHQIVLNTAGLCFMLPLGMGSAASSLVGNALGAKDVKLAEKRGWQVLQLGLWYGILTSLLFFLAPHWLAAFYTDSPSVLAIAEKLFGIVAVFQIFDGAQAILTGNLRGLGDTRSAVWINFVGHWMMGLPLGIWLCFATPMGLFGLWIGLALGLIVVSIGLLRVWVLRLRKLGQSPEPRDSSTVVVSADST